MFYSKNGLMNPSKHDARKVLGDGVADSKSITQFDDLQLLILDWRPPIIHPTIFKKLLLPGYRIVTIRRIHRPPVFEP